MIAIAFAIVIAATLFAPGDHRLLFYFSILGLWLAAFSDDTVIVKHRLDKKIDINIFNKKIKQAVGLYMGVKTAGEKAAAATEELKGEVK